MSSSKATTTAKVVERPDLDPADLMVALCDSLERGGWIESLGSEAVPYVLERLAFLAGSCGRLRWAAWCAATESK